MLAALAENGYESAAISSGSLKAHNGEKCWTRTLGLAPVEMIAGLPVMNRQPLGVAVNRIFSLLRTSVSPSFQSAIIGILSKAWDC